MCFMVALDLNSKELMKLSKIGYLNKLSEACLKLYNKLYQRQCNCIVVIINNNDYKARTLALEEYRLIIYINNILVTNVCNLLQMHINKVSEKKMSLTSIESSLYIIVANKKGLPI